MHIRNQMVDCSVLGQSSHRVHLSHIFSISLSDSDLAEFSRFPLPIHLSCFLAVTKIVVKFYWGITFMFLFSPFNTHHLQNVIQILISEIVLCVVSLFFAFVNKLINVFWCCHFFNFAFIVTNSP